MSLRNFDTLTRRVARYCRAFVLVCLLAAAPLLAPFHSSLAQEIEVQNSSKYIDGELWGWTIYIRASPEIIATIRCVSYERSGFHPFSGERRICELGNPEKPFSFSGVSENSYRMDVEIHFGDGTAAEFEHSLVFETAAPPPGLRLQNTATKIDSKRYEWTVFVQGPEEAIARIRCVRYFLHPTFPNPIQNVCDRQEVLKAFPFTATGWGTFNVRAEIYLKDGSSFDLTHYLKF
jgi:hypothetical protein